MSSKTPFIRIPRNAYVMVGDGRKALFLRNDGDAIEPHLKTEQVLTDDNPPTREQGADRPGRTISGADGRRSAVGQTDWHDLEERRFARTIAEALEKLARDKSIPGFIIAAPPRTLAELRQSFNADVKERIIAELDKDLTRIPVEEIKKHLLA